MRRRQRIIDTCHQCKDQRRFIYGRYAWQCETCGHSLDPSPEEIQRRAAAIRDAAFAAQGLTRDTREGGH